MAKFAKKSLGQNFLKDQQVIADIVAALGSIDGETVIEIGPGRGALTAELLARGAIVAAVEFDRDMVAVLSERFAMNEKFSIINADVLSLDLSQIVPGDKRIKLVGNLPYNISTQILQRLIDVRQRFEVFVLMFQKEVVERIIAKPGGKERGFLSVIAEAGLDIKLIRDVSPNSFIPAPKVWSTVIRAVPNDPSLSDEIGFRKLVSSAFLNKRKTILNNLKQMSPVAERSLITANIDPMRRAETLSLDDWQSLYKSLNKMAESR